MAEIKQKIKFLGNVELPNLEVTGKVSTGANFEVSEDGTISCANLKVGNTTLDEATLIKLLKFLELTNITGDSNSNT